MHRVYRLFAVVEILAVPVAAQLTRGFISGTITDSSGAVMSHVNINVTEGSTGVRHTDLSNEAGVYRIVALEPSVYSVDFSYDGFEPARHEDIGLSSAQEVVVNHVLGVAGATTSA